MDWKPCTNCLRAIPPEATSCAHCRADQTNNPPFSPRQLPAVPPQYPQSNALGGVRALFAILAILGGFGLFSQRGRFTSSASDSYSPGVTADAPSMPAGTTLLDQQGNGQWSSQSFAAPASWAIQYSYDCSGFGQAGNFSVVAHNGNYPGVEVNELQTSGSGTSYVHDVSGANAWLEVGSECSWHVTAVSE